MPSCFLNEQPADAVPLIPVLTGQFQDWLKNQSEFARNWIEGTGFKAKPHTICLAPGGEGTLDRVIVGVETVDDPWALGGLPYALPAGCYYLQSEWEAVSQERLLVGWGLGAYRYTRYKESKQTPAQLVMPEFCDDQAIERRLQSFYLVRDLINTPAADMMPEQLADTLFALAGEFGAQAKQWVGEELLQADFRLIHAVGRASVHAPRLLDLSWGETAHPRITLVGKGVCFDSGGLDLKTANGMRLMKKDMGGAAHALGLARLIMSAGLPVRLRVLIPTVENAVAGNALRPGDVVRSRKGLTVEIDNTDAEGRLILCDALAEAVTDQPELLLDFATLTGAARVALGTEVPALFCNDDGLAEGLLAMAVNERDPFWRLPLHKPYRDMLDSRIADIANSSSGGFGGAITAALFLQEFVPATISWAHFDLMAWNSKARPGRPEGGEAMGLRAVFQYLCQRFGR
ncbi:MAG: leucyl aminopeptidase family protein [Gammaproteobacteria bacterium]|nr:leucyl aminopeptidase family protein [Gammaproteobacteria bacterium]MCP5423479.1 leucyl aminopeptidase family protein [Gammaproteobacteria bacterium]